MKTRGLTVKAVPTKTPSTLCTLIFGKKLTGIAMLLLMLAGCANYGTPKNVAIPDPRVADKYSLHDWREGHSDSDISFILTFSGGGTRASALSYGVMQELRDTNVTCFMDIIWRSAAASGE